MGKQLVQTSAAPSPAGAYSQGLKVGDFVFTAGMGPFDPTTRQLVGQTIEEQTRQTLENIRAVLEAAGASFGDVIKTTVHLGSMELFAGFNEVYQAYFSDPKPVRTTVGSELRGFLVEIDVVAYLGH